MGAFGDWINSILVPNSWGSDYPTGQSASLKPTSTLGTGPGGANPSIGPGGAYPIAGGSLPSFSATGGAPSGPSVTVLGGGGGGGTGQTLGTTTNNEPTPPDQGGIMDAINQAYDAAMSYANQTQSTLEGMQPGMEQNVTNTQTANLGTLNTQKGQGERAVTTEKGDAAKRYQNAISQSRGIFNEAGIGANQRFGRGSQIGRALGEYAGTKFQQAAGNAGDMWQTSVNKLNEAMTQINENYTNGVTQINNWASEQLTNIRNTFQQNLLSISGMRNQAESDKQNARLQALQSYNDQLFAIKSQAEQYNQQIQLNTQGQMSQVQSVADILKQNQQNVSDIGVGNQVASSELTNNTQPWTYNEAPNTGQATNAYKTGILNKKYPDFNEMYPTF